MRKNNEKTTGNSYAKKAEIIDAEIERRLKQGNREPGYTPIFREEPCRVDDSRLQQLVNMTSTKTLITDALDGRYILEEDAKRVTFRYADYMAVIEDIAKIKDDELRTSIIKKLIHGQTRR